MRQALLVGSFLGLGAVMAMACSSSNNVGPGDDGGSSGSSGTSGTSGSSGSSGSSGTSGSSGDGGDAGTNVTTLKTGDAIYLGTTTDGYVAYIAVSGSTASLEVVAATGGTPTVLSPNFAQTDVPVVAGATVAWWSGVTTVKAGTTPNITQVDVGTLNYWTKATGAKPSVATGSATNYFFSSADSSRIAFSVAATAATSDLAVTSATAGSATAVLTGASAINMVAANPLVDSTGMTTAQATCSPFIDFASKALLAAYCTTDDANQARLYTVPDASATAARLDTTNATAKGSIQPFWSASTAGDKLFVISSAGNATGRIILNAATTTSINLDDNTTDGLMLDDGSAAVYQTSTGATNFAWHNATAVASPVKTDLSSAGTHTHYLRFLSPDQKHLVTTSIESGGTYDLYSFASNTTTATPAAIVGTTTAFPFGITPDSATIYYQTDIDNNSNGKLKSQPIGGGTEKTVLDSLYDIRIRKAGNGLIILTNEQVDSTTNVSTVDLSYFDPSGSATAPTPIATGVYEDGFEVLANSIVYSAGGTNAGLFSQPLP